MRQEFSEPLRLAVAGRIKAGKSTLVNAMLRQRVAPTDVGECTKFVTWYRYGVPERVEIVAKDGSRETRSLRSDGSMPPELGIDNDRVHHLEVFLSIDDLRTLTVIDTPGLLSPTDSRSQGTTELLALDRDSRAAVSQADVLVLVMSMDARTEDDEALAAFEAQFDGLRRTALNAVGVLSKIDLIDVGGGPASDEAIDLQAAASVVAERIGQRLRVPLATICPVSTLFAETLGCGLLDERDLHDLSVAMGALEVDERRRLLRTVDRFVDASPEVDRLLSRATRIRLVERLDLSGVERVLALLDAGATPAGVREALRHDSGMDRVREDVLRVLARDSDLLKCARVLTALSRLAADPAARSAVLRTLEELWIEPALHPVRLERARQMDAAGETELPDDLARELHVLARPATGAVVALDRSALAQAVGRWRSYANSGRAGRSERETADAVCRHYELLFGLIEETPSR